MPSGRAANRLRVRTASRQQLGPNGANDNDETFLHRASFTFVTLLSRKALLAIAVVVDVALQVERRRISAKTLAMRHGLQPRHLESTLRSLVHEGTLKSIRGPQGGYELARDRSAVTLSEILRAIGVGDPQE